MKITELSYHYSEYATTNPPRYTSDSLTLAVGDGVTVTDFRSRNSFSEERVYRLTEAQWADILRFCEENRLPDAVRSAIEAERPDPMQFMMGGSRSSAFTCVADGEELTTKNLTPVIDEVLRLMREAVSGMEPVTVNTQGKEDDGIFGIPVSQGFMGVQQKSAAPAPPPPTADGETWTCPACGHHNDGCFCSECGTPKQ